VCVCVCFLMFLPASSNLREQIHVSRPPQRPREGPCVWEERETSTKEGRGKYWERMKNSCLEFRRETLNSSRPPLRGGLL